MLEQLKEKVYIANQDLMEMAPFPFSWVSVSAIDRELGLVIVMPDGGAVTEDDMAIVDMKGNVLEGKEPPVRDMAVHLALYHQFPEIGSIARPYTRWATVFSQLELSIPMLGTVHAEAFPSDIPAACGLPCDVLSDPGHPQIAEAIVQAFRLRGQSPSEIPAVLVNCHGAYTFGADPREAVYHAAILEEAAFLAYHTLQLDPGIRPMHVPGKLHR